MPGTYHIKNQRGAWATAGQHADEKWALLLLLLAACCLPTAAAVWSEAKFKLLKRKRPSENPTKFLTEGNWNSKIIYVKYIENYLAKNENNLELQQIDNQPSKSSFASLPAVDAALM